MPRFNMHPARRLALQTIVDLIAASEDPGLQETDPGDLFVSEERDTPHGVMFLLDDGAGWCPAVEVVQGAAGKLAAHFLGD
jgi:hypothetical protein